MQCRKDLAHFTVFIGFGCVCLLACCMGVYGFIAQETSARLQNYVYASHVPNPALSTEGVEIAANFKGVNARDYKRSFKPLGLESRSLATTNVHHKRIP